MPAGQALDMLRQLQQQLSSPGAVSGFMGQLDQAGLGRVNPRKFFSTPFDESVLRQAVLGRVLGAYGVAPGSIGGVGDPMSIAGGMGGLDRFTGGMRNPFPGGRMDFPAPPITNPPTEYGIGLPQQRPPTMSDGGLVAGDPRLIEESFGLAGPAPAEFGGAVAPGLQAPGGFDFFGRIGQDSSVPALSQDYGQMFQGAIGRMLQNNPQLAAGIFDFQPGTNIPMNPGMGAPSMGGGFGLPGIDTTAQQQINSIFQPQVDQMNMDFQQNQQDLINQMFGTGMNQSSVAADAAGKLLFGRSSALNQIMGQKAQAEMGLRQQLLQHQMDLAKQGRGPGIGGGFGGGGGGGGTMIPQNPSSQIAQLLGGELGRGGGIPLNFEQQMQLAQMQLAQKELEQQGSLGFGRLGLEQMLGLGSQGLQGLGLSQDFLSQLMGQGLSRQQGAAGLRESDLARMQQFLGSGLDRMAGIGQQQAGIEAQRRSMLGSILSGVLGGASSLLPGLGAIGQAGGFGSIFR